MMARGPPSGELAEVDGQGMLVEAPRQSFRIPDTMHLLEAADMSVDTFVDEDSELWLVQLPDPKKVGRQHLSGVHWRVDSGALEERRPCQVATFMTSDGGRQVVTSDGAGSALFCVLPGSGDERQSDDSLPLELLPPPTTEAEVEPKNPQIAPVPKLKKKKKRQPALEKSTKPPKTKKMRTKGVEE